MQGLIGFFDILGYQNFLKNNSALDSALEVLNIITKVPEETISLVDKVSATLQSASKVEFAEAARNLKHLVFSDTIVLTIEFPEGANQTQRKAALMAMTACAGRVAAQMFMKGLPLRGAIHIGEFIQKDMCLAGKGIVDAYHLCESLNFSGVVFSEELEKEYEEILQTDRLLTDGSYRFRYLTSLNNGLEKKLINLNWISYLTPESERKKCESDVEKYVYAAFWGHQKDCPVAVDGKINNTVKAMRKMILNLELVASKQAASAKAVSSSNRPIAKSIAKSGLASQKMSKVKISPR